MKRTEIVSIFRHKKNHTLTTHTPWPNKVHFRTEKIRKKINPKNNVKMLTDKKRILFFFVFSFYTPWKSIYKLLLLQITHIFPPFLFSWKNFLLTLSNPNTIIIFLLYAPDDRVLLILRSAFETLLLGTVHCVFPFVLSFLSPYLFPSETVTWGRMGHRLDGVRERETGASLISPFIHREGSFAPSTSPSP